MPTFYHIFSTGGFIHAGTMWRWMDEVEDVMMRTSLIDEAAGIILDSGPTLEVSPHRAARALVSSCSGLSVEDLDSPIAASSSSSSSSSLLPSSLYSSLVKPFVPATESLMKFWLDQPSMITRRSVKHQLLLLLLLPPATSLLASNHPFLHFILLLSPPLPFYDVQRRGGGGVDEPIPHLPSAISLLGLGPPC